MNPLIVAGLAFLALGSLGTLWWLVHRGDQGPRATQERPGSDAQFAQWLNPQELSDREAVDG